MPGKAAAVTIAEKHRAILHEIARARTSTVQWAKIILLAFDKMFNREISDVVQLEQHFVGLWRLRWQQFGFNRQLGCGTRPGASSHHRPDSHGRRFSLAHSLFNRGRSRDVLGVRDGELVHRSESLARYITRLEGIAPSKLGCNGKSDILKLMATRQKFLAAIARRWTTRRQP
jgi:hypothetical protein